MKLKVVDLDGIAYRYDLTMLAARGCQLALKIGNRLQSPQ